MTEPKFTKGPWRISDRSIIAKGSTDVYSGVVWGTIARLESLKEFDLEGRMWTAPGSVRANAHLIAAAPTMASYIQKQAALGDKEASDIWEQINAC